MKRMSALLLGAAFAMWGLSSHVAAQGQGLQAIVIQGGTLIDGNGGAALTEEWGDTSNTAHILVPFAFTKIVASNTGE